MKLKKSMKKKIAKKWALGNIRNVREKHHAEICVKIHIFFVCKGIESVGRRSTKDEQKTDVLSAKKELQHPENKFPALC